MNYDYYLVKGITVTGQGSKNEAGRMRLLRGDKVLHEIAVSKMDGTTKYIPRMERGIHVDHTCSVIVDDDVVAYLDLSDPWGNLYTFSVYGGGNCSIPHTPVEARLLQLARDAHGI
jgi:hypothetical protein